MPRNIELIQKQFGSHNSLPSIELAYNSLKLGGYSYNDYALKSYVDELIAGVDGSIFALKTDVDNSIDNLTNSLNTFKFNTNSSLDTIRSALSSLSLNVSSNTTKVNNLTTTVGNVQNDIDMVKDDVDTLKSNVYEHIDNEDIHLDSYQKDKISNAIISSEALRISNYAINERQVSIVDEAVRARVWEQTWRVYATVKATDGNYLSRQMLASEDGNLHIQRLASEPDENGYPTKVVEKFLAKVSDSQWLEYMEDTWTLSYFDNGTLKSADKVRSTMPSVDPVSYLEWTEGRPTNPGDDVPGDIGPDIDDEDDGPSHSNPITPED